MTPRPLLSNYLDSRRKVTLSLGLGQLHSFSLMSDTIQMELEKKHLKEASKNLTSQPSRHFILPPRNKAQQSTLIIIIILRPRPELNTQVISTPAGLPWPQEDPQP